MSKNLVNSFNQSLKNEKVFNFIVIINDTVITVQATSEEDVFNKIVTEYNSDLTAKDIIIKKVNANISIRNTFTWC